MTMKATAAAAATTAATTMPISFPPLFARRRGADDLCDLWPDAHGAMGDVRARPNGRRPGPSAGTAAGVGAAGKGSAVAARRRHTFNLRPAGMARRERSPSGCRRLVQYAIVDRQSRGAGRGGRDRRLQLPIVFRLGIGLQQADAGGGNFVQQLLRQFAMRAGLKGPQMGRLAIGRASMTSGFASNRASPNSR